MLADVFVKLKVQKVQFFFINTKLMKLGQASKLSKASLQIISIKNIKNIWTNIDKYLPELLKSNLAINPTHRIFIYLCFF